MAINFPSNPTVNDEYTSGSNTWIWDGVSWNVKPPGSNLDDLSDVNVSAATGGQVLYFNDASNNWEPLSLTSSFNGGSISNVLSIQNATVSNSTTNGALVVLGGTGIGGALNVGGSVIFGSTGRFSGTLTVTTGGAAITGNSTVTGTLTSTSTLSSNADLSVTTTGSFGSHLTVRSSNELRLNDADNTNHISLKSPSNLTANVVYQLPSADGSAGQVLTTNGSGALSWSTVTGGGGGGEIISNPPGGSTGNIQYNNNGSFGGSSTLNYNILTDTVELYNLQVDGNVEGNGSTTVTNITSFAFVQGVSVDKFSDDDALTGNSNTTIPTEAAVKGYVDNGLLLKADADNPTFTGTVSGITKTMVGLSLVENTAISTWPGSSSITTVGTLTSVTVSGDITANNNVVITNAPSTMTHATNKRYVDSRSIAMSIALS